VDSYSLVALCISATPAVLLHVAVRQSRSVAKWGVAGALALAPIAATAAVSPDIGIPIAVAEFAGVYYLSLKKAPQRRIVDERPEKWDERIKRVHPRLPEDRKSREGIERELISRMESAGEAPSVTKVMRMLTGLYGSEVRVYETTVISEVTELVASNQKLEVI
jgi:hypothetical protein